MVLLGYFFVFVEITFFIFFSTKLTFFPLIFIQDEKKLKLCYNNLGVQGVITYFIGSLNESYFNMMVYLGLIKTAWCLL